MNDRRTVIAALLIATALALAYFTHDFLNLDHLQQQQSTLQSYRASHPVFAAGLFCLLFIALAALSLPVAGVLSLVGGALFGFGMGMVLVSASSIGGAVSGFLLSRYLLRGWFIQRFGAYLGGVQTGFAREGGFYLFAMRMIPVIPYFVLNPLMGLTVIPLRQFVIVSLIGMAPAMAILVFAGTRFASIKSLHQVFDPGLVLALSAMGLMPLVGKVVIGWMQIKKKPANGGQRSQREGNSD
jgi:uncharacterized membrane protein YdjX (TVP38/TMEM64 family)